ncbi:MAG: YlxR family protein [Candidatus Rokubacteria bacterium]|nr:YlxR family protein [Candidatus Rokubacteria bacterium]MBI3827210.1 YlxR family protein [Candidatus Rokubacteria bacterium]
MRDQGELVRLVRRADGRVVLDAARRAAGRGTWVCGDGACLERALKPGRLAQAFRRPCEVGTNLAEEVRALWQQRRSR